MKQKPIIKILNLNLWNTNYYWPQRKQLIIELIKKHRLHQNPYTLLTFQEVVKDQQTDQLSELNQALNFPTAQFFPAKEIAGQGLLTNLPLNHYQIFPFTTNPEDPHDTFPRMIALSEMQIQNQKFILGITHFAVKVISSTRNAQESLTFIQKFNSQNYPLVIAGDFNCTIDEPPCQLYQKVGFCETWAQLKLPEFPSWPVETDLVIRNKLLRDGQPPSYPIHPRRVDYIWYQKFKPLSAVKFGQKKKDLWHSDHWGILAELEMD